MKTHTCQPGTILDAMRRHHASPAVEVDAAALEHELCAEQPDRRVLLQLAGSFARQYPAIILGEQAVLSCLLGACLEALGDSDEHLHARPLLVLLDIVAAVVEQALRQGPKTVPAQVPQALRKTLEAVELQHVSRLYLGEVAERLLIIGRQVAMVGEEGNPPQSWFDLLARTTQQALLVCQRRREERLPYPGLLETVKRGGVPGGELLQRLASSQPDADLDWLAELRRQLEHDSRPAVNAFLELYTWRRRSDVDDLWQEWLGQVAAQAVAGELDQAASDTVLSLLADLLDNTVDRRSLRLLTRSLQRHLPYLLAACGEQQPGLRRLVQAAGSRSAALGGDGELQEQLRQLQQSILLASSGKD